VEALEFASAALGGVAAGINGEFDVCPCSRLGEELWFGSVDGDELFVVG